MVILPRIWLSLNDFFWSGCSHQNMPPTAAHPTAHTYSTSNTPPLTTHLALNVCEALRGQCPCDEYRDETRNDWFFHVCTSYTSDQFRRKQLHRATTVRRQRPWTNALGGLYLPCLNRMLGCRWVDGRAVALRWYTSEWGKSRRRLSSPEMVWFSLHGEVALYRISLQGGDNPHSLTLILDQGQIKHSLNSTGRIIQVGRLPLSFNRYQ